MKRLYVPSLVTGLLCLSIASAVLLLSFGLVPLAKAQQLLAGCLVVTGSIGMVVAMRHRRLDHS